MTERPSRRQPLLATTSAKIAAGLFAVIILASIPMVVAEARHSTTTAARAPAASTPREGAMPPPAYPPRAALTRGHKAEVALQVTSLHAGNRITGRILRPIDPTLLAHTKQTITVQLEPGASTTMGSSADVKPGALLQANGTTTDNGTLDTQSIVVLTGHVQLR
jgi:hypothetical protein